MRENLIGGIIAAVALALLFAVPSVAGIAMWKIVAGILGLILFAYAGTMKPRA